MALVRLLKAISTNNLLTSKEAEIYKKVHEKETLIRLLKSISNPPKQATLLTVLKVPKEAEIYKKVHEKETLVRFLKSISNPPKQATLFTS